MPSTSGDPRNPFLEGFQDGRPHDEGAEPSDPDVIDAEVVEDLVDGVGRRYGRNPVRDGAKQTTGNPHPLIGEVVQYIDPANQVRAGIIIKTYGSGLVALTVFAIDADPVQYRAVGYDLSGTALNSWRRVDDAR